MDGPKGRASYGAFPPAGRARRHVARTPPPASLFPPLPPATPTSAWSRALPPIATGGAPAALSATWRAKTLDDALGGRADAACGAACARAIDFLRRAGCGDAGRRPRRAADGYLELARRLSEAPPTASVALDLSHVGQDVSAEFCLRQLERIVDAPARWARGLDVGAEDSSRIDTSHPILVALRPAWRARTGHVCRRNLPPQRGRLARAWWRRGLGVRLVKGAYVEPGASGPSLRAGHRRCLPPASPASLRAGGGTRDAGYPRRRAFAMASSPSSARWTWRCCLGVRPEDHAPLPRRAA